MTRANATGRAKPLGRELRRKKNLYGIMIQQAVKHALSRARTEIMFQAGDACEIAQWRQKNFCQITVTEKNYALVNKIYQEEMDRFVAGPGVVIPRPDLSERDEVVIKTTAAGYITRYLRGRVAEFAVKNYELDHGESARPRGAGGDRRLACPGGHNRLDQ